MYHTGVRAWVDFFLDFRSETDYRTVLRELISRWEILLFLIFTLFKLNPYLPVYSNAVALLHIDHHGLSRL
jgi:hypothetical protein